MKRSHKRRVISLNHIFEVLPFIFILVILLLHLIIADKTFSKEEKRYLTQYPTISVDKVLDNSFQRGIETYFSDQFPFRDLWINILEII